MSRVAFVILLFALTAILESVSYLVLSTARYGQLRKVLLTEAGTDEVPRLTSHPYLNYFPTPGFSIGGVQLHNEHGYRGTSVAVSKPENTTRILFLGGSTTYSYFTNEPDSTLPELVRSVLPDSCDMIAANVEVINGGLPSGTSAELLTHYLFKYRYYSPDIVVIHAGGNDAIGNAVSGPYHPDLSHFRKNFVDPTPPPKMVRWLLRSRFISVFIIRVFYREYTDGDHFGHLGEDLTCKWYDAGSFPEHHKEHDAFYRNITTLVKAAIDDGATVLVVPFIVNDRFVSDEWPGIADEYLGGIASNRLRMREISSLDGAYFCNLKSEHISENRYWLDDCHLTPPGTLEKAAVIGKCICASVRQMRIEPARD